MNGPALPAPSRHWIEALRHHRDAADAVIGTASLVPAAEWNRPIAPGKWSPAEIIEHLRLTTAVLTREIDGGEAMRIRTGWLQRLVIRLVFLRRILRSGRFPAGARAVREIQPHDGPYDQSDTTRGLEEELRRFERALAARPDARMTHPIFGVADARTGLRFCTVHLWHHRDQIERRERQKDDPR